MPDAELRTGLGEARTGGAVPTPVRRSHAPRVLFVTARKEDYLQDTLLTGLRNLLGEHAVDLPRKHPLYVDEPRAKRDLYGRGFTLWKTLPTEAEPVRPNRIASLLAASGGGFDLVVFGSVRRMPGALRWARLGRALRGLARRAPRTPWVFVDGEDASDIDARLLGLGTYYKRELRPEDAGRARPIQFAIPARRLVPEVPDDKPRLFATHVQCEVARAHPWIAEHCQPRYAFDREEDYYADLRGASFAVTMKKAGWDCMRHYEIAASGTVPCFWKLDEKPASSAPHGLVDGVNCVVFETAQELERKTTELLRSGRYPRVAAGALAWAREHTSERLARRILADVFPGRGWD